MAILPGAIVKIVSRHTTPRVGQRGFCLHIAVSNGASLYNYFNQSGNPTSHFYVRRTGNTDGMSDFEQYVDTKYRAPANLEGNPTLISLETQGGVGDDLNNPWPSTMVRRIAWILAECHKLDGIPLQAMPNSLPTSEGVGYHRQGVDPWRVDGGEQWSTAYGKVCPGDVRIEQIPQIITLARQLASTSPPPKELFTVGQFEDIMAKLNKIDTDATSRYGDIANRVQAVLNEERARYTDYVGRFNAVLDDLAADPNNPITPEDAAQFREMAAAVDRIELALAPKA